MEKNEKNNNDYISEDDTEDIEQEDKKSIEDEKKDKELLESHVDNVMPINLSSCMKDSFLSYAMSVIVARALPDVRDGLKPVQRRILFTMGELGVYSDKPHKKSARIVGDVMGKYHPHGDTAIYEAMVRMAQDFSYRYPLADGHGNFGSIDGDGAAAMRYTETRLSKIASEMLRDLNKDTVDFIDNYDGTEQEPEVLPSRFPNLLVNGANGIAVGMATSIPTHNLGEVINATLAIIKDPNITIDRLMDIIPGPDFPTGGIIMGVNGAKKAYETGLGGVICRAKVEIVELSNGKKEILVREIPYQVNKARLIDRIAELARDKVIEGITDLRDESSRKGMKIVIELRKDCNANVVLNNLYKYTQMQTTFSINMIALDHGQPKVLNLKQVLEAYIEHQISVVRRRVGFDLKKAKDRLHIVEGLLIALSSIDDVIATIKSSKSTDEAISQLCLKFLLTETQAKAILDMKLQRLTGLEVEKLKEESIFLKEQVKEFTEILENHDKLMGVIVAELEEISNKYSDNRRSEINLTDDLDVADEDLIPEDKVIITITKKGYIKRLSADTYRSQRRGGKGVTGTKMQEDDFVERIIYTSTHDNIMFFTNFGKVYVLKAFEIPQFNRFAKGLPVVNLLKLDENEKLAAVINVKSLDDPGFIIFGTKKGNIKKTELCRYKNIRSTGIIALGLNDGDELIAVEKSYGNGSIILGASNGRAVRFDECLVRPTNRSAVGVKAIKLNEGEKVVGMSIVYSDDDQLVIITENGYGKRTKAASFLIKGRNGKGVKYLNYTEKSGNPAALCVCQPKDDLVVVTDKGMIIRTSLEHISVIGRDTQGVCIIKLNEGHKVSSIAVVPHEEEKETQDEKLIVDDPDLINTMIDPIENPEEDQEIEEEKEKLYN